jgi:NADPH-dependent F420 reductase
MLWIKLAIQWGIGRNIGFGISLRTAGEALPSRRDPREGQGIAIVGSGNIGGALARAWLGAGHDVRIATRDARSKEVSELVDRGAKALPVADAAKNAEVVVFAIPASAVVDVAKSMGGLAGKIVVDCTNAIAKGFSLQFGHTTSSSEEIARALPDTRVVRSFNQQGAETLQNPLFGGLPATNFVASDDNGARRLVRDLAADIGLDAVEAGPLASSRYLEPITLLWVAMAQSLGTREFGLSLLRR